MAWAVRHRFAITLCLALLFADLEVASSWTTGTDWDLLRNGGLNLLGKNALHVYVRVPGLQAGPLSLLFTGTLCRLCGAFAGTIGHLLLIAELPCLLWVAERGVRLQSRQPDDPTGVPALAVLLSGVFLAPVWADLAGATIHLDDGMALMGGLVAIVLVPRGCWRGAALAAGAAAAAKPWAVAALPVLFGLRHRRAAALLVASAVPASFWLPELIDRRNLSAASWNPFSVSPDAPLRLFHLFGSTMPPWQRPLELTAILLAAALAAVRGRWADAFAVGMLARLLCEVATLPYYDVDALVAVLGADIIGRRVPWRSALLWLAVEGGHLLAHPADGWLRLFALVVLLGSYVRRWPVDVATTRVLVKVGLRSPLLAS